MENIVLQSFHQAVSKRKKEKYQVIERLRNQFSIKKICEILGISYNGYYKWKKKTGIDIGYRQITIWLKQEKRLIVNHKKVLRIMQENYLLSEIRRVRAYYYNKQGVKTYQNLLNRNFNCSSVNQKWGTDISYIKTKKGNVYLSVIKDLYDNFIVAYKISKTQNQQLVSQTINKDKNDVAKNLILHSDRGFQYTSLEYNSILQRLSITPSMSRAGNPLDMLKTSLVY